MARHEYRSGPGAQDFPPAVPVEAATVLYRIAQETLRNVAKHAGKAHIKVLLRGKPTLLEPQVLDSGLGFDMWRTSGRGWALLAWKSGRV
jgi:signal transduction histidine kinase